MQKMLAASFCVLACLPATALAADLPAGGMTAGDVASWLQNAGYLAKIDPGPDGKSHSILSASDGLKFVVLLNDCKGDRCGSLEFFAAFDTNGTSSGEKMNAWNVNHRWTTAYVDNAKNPCLRLDVDVSPGGTVEMLNDQFILWRFAISDFSHNLK